MQRCTIHDMAAGPDGACALCRSHRARVAHRVSNRRWRPVARLVVAVFAGIGTFAWLLATFDTAPPRLVAERGIAARVSSR